jgi:hypothetical protein
MCAEVLKSTMACNLQVGPNCAIYGDGEDLTAANALHGELEFIAWVIGRLVLTLIFLETYPTYKFNTLHRSLVLV